MSLIVQKYGGTSVASPERIKKVARRVIQEHNQNNKVVVVVSAMGNTTDRLINLMNRISTDPHPREVDMLLTTGEQQSIALLTMAIHKYGYPAISLTGSQARIHTDDNHNRAEIKKVDNDRILQELDRKKIVVVA
ncbi:MAG: aspartate kinase, partial [Halanaerobiales bacterium]